jgi:HPt (histidine-containing phosphotransfer) domain-containing protein
MVDMTDLSNQPLTVMASPPIAGDEPAIDVAHLRRMTLGDRSLEVQVLELFDRQSELLLARMGEVAPAAVASLAHTLVGSARGIGAMRVAAAAAALERAVTKTADLASALQRLDGAVNEARLAIGAMLRQPATA